MRPNFPQGTKDYSINAPLEPEPFGRRALRRFKYYEHPMEVSPEREFFKELGVVKGEAAAPGFRTVGELYQLIASGFSTISEKALFIGDPRRRVGEAPADFPDSVLVHDRDSALRAIDQITEQVVPRRRRGTRRRIARGGEATRAAVS